MGMNRNDADPSGSLFGHRGSLLPSSSSLYSKRKNSGDSYLEGDPTTAARGPCTSPMSCTVTSTPALKTPAPSPKRNGASLEGNRRGNVMHGLASPSLSFFCPCPGDTAWGGGRHGHLNLAALEIRSVHRPQHGLLWCSKPANLDC